MADRTLYHLWLSPACRMIRIALAEKGLGCELKLEKIWEKEMRFLRLNPAGDVPVLKEPDGTVLSEPNVIYEYLEEAYPDRAPLLGDDLIQRAETRRLVAWFERLFGREVTDNLVGEKVMGRFYGRRDPDGAKIRMGLDSIGYHLEYIGWLTERRRWLAGDDFSLADVAAAAHLSAVDYLGDVPWSQYDGAKTWYYRVKSRPSMRDLLTDIVPGRPPSAHYADLDFE